MKPTKLDLRRLEIVAEALTTDVEKLEAAAIPCPRCTRGTTGPDSNGSYWRCAYCGGSGRLKRENE